MKKRFINLIVLLCALTTLHAQEYRIGVSGGIDAARFAFSGSNGEPLKTKSGLTGGILGEVQFNSPFAIQCEVNYSSQGTGYFKNGVNVEAAAYDLSYITVPVLLKMYGTPKFSFYVGPQIGFLLKAKTENSNKEDEDVKSEFKSTDIYAVFGTEYRFANGIFISGRYNYGLSNLLRDESSLNSFKNRYYSFRVGYSVQL